MQASGFGALFAVALIAHVARAHPQCLDFRPPFQVERGLDFCSQYSDFGCCSREQDYEIRQEMRHIRSQMGDNALESCRDILKEVLCQRCSPFAVHIYDAETSYIRRPFPGLCRDFCGLVYRQCRQLIPLLTEDAAIWKALESEELFCEQIRNRDEDYCYPALLTDPIMNRQVVADQTAEDGCLCLEEIAGDLRNPLLLRSPDDGTGRMFVAEQVGAVHIFYKNGSKIAEPFLNLTDQVLTSTWRGDERGFLGLTFHPEYATNGRLYVYYSIRKDGDAMIRISQLHVQEHNPNRVNHHSERILLEIRQPFWNHNGGELLFGPDGYLYAFVGDGGGAGDPDNHAQNLDSLLGKVLRLDVTVPSDSEVPYLIPADNPFVYDGLGRPEIYAYGIRNIWRCDVDEGDPETGYGEGRIICGDVGQDNYEEINIIENGGNYGWNSREGFECFNEYTCGQIGPEVMPIYAYNHSLGKSVTGGHVYRGCLNPALNGQYIYGDFVSGRLFSLKENFAEGTWTNQALHMCEDSVCGGGLTGQYEPSILSFGEDDDGEIYILSTSFASPAKPYGKIYKIVDPRRRGDPELCRSFIAKKAAETTSTTSTTTTTKAPKTNPIYTSAHPPANDRPHPSTSSSFSTTVSAPPASKPPTPPSRKPVRGVTAENSASSIRWIWTLSVVIFVTLGMVVVQ